jgi:sugar O-acyltransferase (sialic acid O-acetyltransferase NeuD family)
MNKNNGLIILGFGGHARSIADVALSIGFKSLIFIDENAKEGETFLGFKVLRDLPEDIPDNWLFMPAAGDNQKRQNQVQFIHSIQKSIAKIISKSATVGYGAKLSAGCFVAHHAHIGPMSSIGCACIVNTGAVIEHECVVDDFSHLSVNSVLLGRSTLGKFVFLGAGTTVINGISISDQVTIGAGGVVVKSIYKSGVYVGIPAKLITSSSW